MSETVLPPDWQQGMVAMIRGQAPLEGDWFTGGPVLSGEQQIAVYRQQYRLRMWSTLIDEIPGLFALLGDQAGEVLWAYLDACPSQSWTLAHLAVRLPEWLEAQGAPVEQVELAWVEVAVNQGFTAGEGHDVDPARLSAAPRLRLQPHVSLRRLTRDVHRWRSEAAGGGEPAPLETGDWPLVLYRRERRMRHRVIPGAWFALLEAFGPGRGLGEVLNEAVVGGVDAEWLASQLTGWFRDMVAWRWLEVVPQDAPLTHP
jgi:hypothetical protein